MKQIVQLCSLFLLVSLSSCAKDIVYEPRDVENVQDDEVQVEALSIAEAEEVNEDFLAKVDEMTEDLKEREKELFKKLEKLPNLQPQAVKNTNIVRITNVAKRAFDASTDIDEEFQNDEKTLNDDQTLESSTSNAKPQKEEVEEKEETRVVLDERSPTPIHQSAVHEEDTEQEQHVESQHTVEEPSKDVDNSQAESAEQNSVDERQSVAQQSAEEELDNTTEQSVEPKVEKSKTEKTIKSAIVVTCDECLQNYSTTVEDVGDGVYVWKLQSVRNMSIVRDWIEYVSQKTKVRVGPNWLIGKFDEEALKEAAVVLSDALKKYEQIRCTVYLSDGRSVNFLSKKTVDLTYKEGQLYRIRIECSETSCHVVVVDNHYKSVYDDVISYDTSSNIQNLFSIKIRKL